jgi:hypothetical protein
MLRLQLELVTYAAESAAARGDYDAVVAFPASSVRKAASCNSIFLDESVAQSRQLGEFNVVK